jgi:hypothetical protein
MGADVSAFISPVINSCTSGAFVKSTFLVARKNSDIAILALLRMDVGLVDVRDLSHKYSMNVSESGGTGNRLWMCQFSACRRADEYASHVLSVILCVQA